MTRRPTIAPDRRGFVVETTPFPETERRWSAVITFSLTDDRLSEWKPLIYVYAMPPGFEVYRFKASDLEASLPELSCRLKTHAGTWIKANCGSATVERAQ